MDENISVTGIIGDLEVSRSALRGELLGPAIVDGHAVLASAFKKPHADIEEKTTWQKWS